MLRGRALLAVFLLALAAPAGTECISPREVGCCWTHRLGNFKENGGPMSRADCAAHRCQVHGNTACCGGGTPGGNSSKPRRDIVDEASGLAASEFMKGNIDKGFGAVGLGLVGGALQQGVGGLFRSPRKPADDGSRARARQQEAYERAARQERARLEAQRKREEAERTRSALLAEWQGVEASSTQLHAAETSDDLVFQWGTAKPEPEFSKRQGEADAAEASFSLQDDAETLRRKALAVARDRLPKAALDEAKLGVIKTRIPEQGSMSVAVYRPRLEAALVNLTAWLKKIYGDGKCFVEFEAARNTCVDEGTVASLKTCFHLSVKEFNECEP